MTKPKPPTPLGTFEEHVLLAVLRVDHAYGMPVRHELERLTEREVSIGAVYATLDRLEIKGLVTSQRETIEGRSRRTFSVTADGTEALGATRAMRRRLWAGDKLAGSDAEPSAAI